MMFKCQLEPFLSFHEPILLDWYFNFFPVLCSIFSENWQVIFLEKFDLIIKVVDCESNCCVRLDPLDGEIKPSLIRGVMIRSYPKIVLIKSKKFLHYLLIFKQHLINFQIQTLKILWRFCSNWTLFVSLFT